jgi:K+-transporting ATPase KdpF subunit
MLQPIKTYVVNYWEVWMNIIYVVGGIVSLALFVYLVIALLKPEAFS